MNFFDEYKRFYTTSETSPYPTRLNARFMAIIDQHKDRLRGKKILDIGSHDGRWSFAALKCDAKHVTGIEPRIELVNNANMTFQQYEINENDYAFIQGDAFAQLTDNSFDVVFCLGFFYHTIRHVELIDKIERTGARFVVIDTEVTHPSSNTERINVDDERLIYQNPYNIKLLSESVDNQQMACADKFTRNGKTIVGRPSVEAIVFIANHFGYEVERYAWNKYFEKNPSNKTYMADYVEGWRETFYLHK